MSICPLRDRSGSFDRIVIANTTCPGYFKFTTTPKRGYGWDKKKGKGTQGETLTFVQFPASEGKGKFYLWLPRHWDEWEDFRPLLKYDPTKDNPQPYEMFHPACADIDLHSVVTEYLGSIEHEGKGLFSVEWAFNEYFPASTESVVSTPTTSSDGGGTGPEGGIGTGLGGSANPNDAQSSLDKENSDLLKKAQNEGAL